MATNFLVAISRDKFIERAKKRGWKDGKLNSGAYALVSENGHYCQCIHESRIGTTFARYGDADDVNDLAESLGAICDQEGMSFWNYHYGIEDEDEEGW